MRFSTFIKLNLEEILTEWDKFASTLFTGEDKKKPYLLRDHAREILLEITADMDTHQSPEQQAPKSKRLAPFHPDDSAANVHGVQRQDDGFTVSQVAAEFRALRASVLRLWLSKLLVMSEVVRVDIVRFNESIDEAVADSIVTFTA